MAEAINLEDTDISFWRAHPRDLSGRFTKIQDLRCQYYKEVFRPHRRSDTEVEHFVGKLTLNGWNEPNNKKGQLRVNPQVVAALDGHKNVVAFHYTAENVSSALPGVLGKAELAAKLRIPTKRYVWSSESVHDGDHAELVSVLAALSFEGYNPDQPGTWYPWTEEIDLKVQLQKWDYQPIDNPTILEDDEGFGVGSRITKQRWWVAGRIGDVIDSIYGQPGMAEAMQHAHDALEPHKS